MASIIFLVAGLVIGLIAGWFIWGRSRSSTPSATPAPADAQPVTTADLTEASPDAADAALLTLDAEPATDTTAVITSEPAGTPADADPTAATQVLTPPDADATQVVHPTTDPADAAATQVVTTESIPTEPEPVATEPNPAPTALAADAEPVAVEAEPAAVVAEPVAAVAEPVAAETEPAIAEAVVTEPVVAESAVDEPIVAEAEAVTEPAAVTIPEQVSPATAPEPDPIAASAAPVTVPVPGAAESDVVTAAPTPVAVAIAEPDDLTRIPGIGPKMAMALAVAGITTYRQLADTDVPTLRAAISNAGMRVAPTLPTWPDRAKALTDSAA